MPRRALIHAALVVGSAALALTACQDTGAAGQAADASPALEDTGEDQDMHFTFSGEDGQSGCRYRGPTSLQAGLVPLTVVNTSAETVTIVTWRFGEDYAYDDYLEVYEGGIPYDDPNTSYNPDWLDGGWRPMIDVQPGQEGSIQATLASGEFGSACYLPGNPEVGRHWPATPFTVRD
jgi:hypothetical protein